MPRHSPDVKPSHLQIVSQFLSFVQTPANLILSELQGLKDAFTAGATSRAASMSVSKINMPSNIWEDGAGLTAHRQSQTTPSRYIFAIVKSFFLGKI